MMSLGYESTLKQDRPTFFNPYSSIHVYVLVSVFYMILSGLRVGPLKDAPLPWTCHLTQLRRHDIGRPRRPVVSVLMEP